LESWFYIPEEVTRAGAGWIYCDDLEKLEISFLPTSNWGWSLKLNKRVYVQNGGTTGHGWVLYIVSPPLIQGQIEVVFLLNWTSLDLSNQQTIDLEPFRELTQLTWLDLSNNQISDLSPLADLTQLTYLDLKGNPISDFSPLAGLVNLTSLDLNNQQISDLESFRDLTQLTWLDLSNNQISDLSPLAELPQLTYLDLSNNDIRDLAELPQLTYLDLSWNRISDLSPLAGLTQLRDIDGEDGTFTPALNLRFNYIDINWDSPARQIIEGLWITNEVTVFFAPQMDYDTWAGYPIRPDGTVDTWGWLDVLNIDNAPWVLCEALNNWLYVTESCAQAGCGWIYVLDVTGLQLAMMDSTSWGWSYSLDR